MPGFEEYIKAFITTGTVLFLLLIFIVSIRIANKRGDNLKRWIYLVGYLFDFAAFIGAALYIAWLWGYDFQQFIDIYDSIRITISDEVFIVKIISTVFTLFITLFILKISKVTISNVGKKPGSIYRRRRTLAKLTLSIIRYLGWIIALLVILAIWGINIGPALAGLGILGLVIGLGAQKFINDLISGLFIIFEQHYDVGDIIESNGFKGEVIDIGLKTTRIKNWKGEVKILANGSISDTINYSKNPSLAIVDFGIAYAEDVEKTTNILKKELPKFTKSYPEIIEDPEILGVVELAGSSVNIRVIARTLTNQHFNIERQLRAFIKATLDKHNIEIPFPQVVVHEAKPTPKKKTTTTVSRSTATKSPKTVKSSTIKSTTKMPTKKKTTGAPSKVVRKKVASSPAPKRPSKSMKK